VDANVTVAAEVPNIPELQSLARHEHELTWRMPDDSIVIRPALILTVFFANGYSPEGRAKIAECFDYFFERWGDHMRGKYFSEGKYTRMRPQDYPVWRKKMVDLGPNYALCLEIGSESSKVIAPEYGIVVLTSQNLREQQFGERSYLKIHLPWRTLLTDEGRQQYLDLVRFVSNTLSVEHGHGGLSPVMPFDFDRFLSFEYPISQQFSGLMIDGMAHSDTLKLKDQYVKGINWITIVGDGLADKLGGRQAIREQLSVTSVAVDDYETGIIVRAGDYPALGAEEEGLPPLYIAVNRVLKPLRIPDPDQLHYHMPDRDSFDKERTLKWYARFDVPEAQEVEQPGHRLRGLPSEEVPEAGQWWTPALQGQLGRRRFEKGERFPDIQYSAYGAVIWYLDND
jgi:Type VI immunity for VRR-NUC